MDADGPRDDEEGAGPPEPARGASPRFAEGGRPAEHRPPPPRAPAPAEPERGDSLGHFFAKVFIATLTIPVTLGLLLIIVVLAIAVAGAGARAGGLLDVEQLQTAHLEGPEDAGEYLLSVPVEGIILGEESPDPFGIDTVVNGYEVKRALELAADDDTVRGVVLEVSSPGGTIYGSRAIADGVRIVRAAGKPVTAFVRGLSASGAVYAIAPAQQIWADNGSTIGSIGVIAGPFTYYDEPVAVDGGVLTGGVVTEQGVEQRYITAGDGKDLGNPYRRLTDREIRSLQATIDDEYDAFVSFVSEHRGIPEQTIVDELGALIYGNDQAQAAGLIDETRNRDEARDATAELAGLAADYELRELSTEPGLLQMLTARLVGTDRAATGHGCALASQALAYHGDPATLCASAVSAPE